MRADFSLYTTEYISGVMSLRKPQKKSLEILDKIVNNVNLKKGMNLQSALDTVKGFCPTCADFERDFMSLTFALATGVGKTRLMGAFIAYLYTQHNIKNFFVVAPNTTIYKKLCRDLNDTNNEKYVFRGLSCFANAPRVITGEDYLDKTISFLQSEVSIFVFNIGKFDKDNANMKNINEYYGKSFFETLANLPDLVLIMDESHHYHGEKGEQALNELHPLLGLELTATPLMVKKSKGNQIPFKNVVYEYPLSQAIADGYTRTPFAVTRSDVDFYNFGDEQIDRLMLQDGIICHERIKQKLQVYAANNGKKAVKPFVLVVCKNTAHAKWVEEYVKSDAFCNGAYKNKVVVVHSKQGAAESDANTQMLLEVEKPDNIVEIVIHVDKLKEGWDVNNLYTIIPLRTAASKILREQMVGRGLRLPYGERTGDKDIDSVMLTAHDKFKDILEEAQKGDSIFKAGNVIKVEEIEPEEVSDPQLALEEWNEEPDDILASAYKATGVDRSEQSDTAFQAIQEAVKKEVYQTIQSTPTHTVMPSAVKKIAKKVVSTVTENADLAQVFHENSIPAIVRWAEEHIEKVHRAAEKKFIPIPQIRITDAGAEEYVFMDFDVDLSNFNHEPLTNEMLIQNLEDQSDQERVRTNAIDFDGYEPKRVILGELRKKPEIDYNKCKSLLFKLITQVTDNYERCYGMNGMQNIVMMNKRDIDEKIYKQMMQHFYCDGGLIQEEVVGARKYNLPTNFSYRTTVHLYDKFEGNIRSVRFIGIKKGVFEEVNFDSDEGELSFARIVERDEDVLNWLRPSPKEFNITYNHGKNYEPDFVVETEDTIYLVEVKAEKDLNDPDVIAKKKRGILYCETVTHWSEANGYKPWKYLFIPANQIYTNSTFMMIAKKFTVTE